MVTPTDPEPRPRIPPWLSARERWEGLPRTSLSRNVREPDTKFLDVLRRRRSVPGSGPISTDDLSSILWHATLLRERRAATSEFPAWESRAAPSAGGLHVISLLCLPLAVDQPAGIYDPDRHELIALDQECLAVTRRLNSENIIEICGAVTGTSIQFVADMQRAEAAYEYCWSLVWRDAGALVTTLALVAEALGFAATPLGRVGSTIIRSAGLHAPRWRAVGALHITPQLVIGSEERSSTRENESNL